MSGKLFVSTPGKVVCSVVCSVVYLPPLSGRFCWQSTGRCINIELKEGICKDITVS